MKDAAENEKRLLRASRRLLRPLARILLRNGISAKAFQELGRKVFVDVAFEEFRLENKPQTISRVAVITGLNRKEVARLRGSPAPDEADELVWHNRATTVMAAWFTDPDFLDRKGDPLDLPFDGATASFTTLVRKHSGDMQPRAVADELLHSGALETVDDRLRMTRRGYVPASDPGRLIDILGIHTAELVETIDRNMQTDDEERLYRLAYWRTTSRPAICRNLTTTPAAWQSS